jgi:phage baseplate assembly protein W
VSQPDRAFRFVGAGFDTAGTGGLVVTSRGSLALAEGDAAVRQAILLLLSTSPGERVNRPDYGSHLHRLVFAPNDETTAGLAIHYVRQALHRWEPRVQIVDLDAGADPTNPALLYIRLEYRVVATQVVDTIAVSLDLYPMAAPRPAGGGPR